MRKEYWDLYDKEGKSLNKKVLRGNKLSDDEYHIVVNAWIKNSNNEFLITRRSINKSKPLMWECTGGSALAGESPLDAAIREVKEELGINLNKDNVSFIGKTNRYYQGCPDILYVYLFKCDISLDKIKIQEEEVDSVMWASKEEVLELYNNKKFEANMFFDEVINQEQVDIYNNKHEKLNYTKGRKELY